jgi:HD-like signal output (HDOD) protein
MYEAIGVWRTQKEIDDYAAETVQRMSLSRVRTLFLAIFATRMSTMMVHLTRKMTEQYWEARCPR